MRLIPLWTFLMLLEIGMLIFTSTAENTPTMLQSNMTASLNSSGTGLASNVSSASSANTWTFIYDPVNWNSNAFINLILTGLIIGGAIGIGTSFFFRSDLTILYPLFIVIFGSGLVPITQFWLLLNSGIGNYACEVGTNCFTSTILSALICMPLTLYWLGACLEFYSGRPAS